MSPDNISAIIFILYWLGDGVKGRHNYYNVLFCPSVFCVRVYIILSNNDNNNNKKTQVHKTFVSDANCIVAFMGRQTNFCILLGKPWSISRDFSCPPKVLHSCHLPNFFPNSLPTGLSYLLNLLLSSPLPICHSIEFTAILKYFGTHKPIERCFLGK